MTDPLLAPRDHYHEYFYADGLYEIAHAIDALLFGVFFVSVAVKEPAVALTVAGWIAVPVMILFGMYEKRMLATIRERITYPRIGLVEPLTLEEAGMHTRRRIVTAALAVSLLVVFGGSLLIAIGVMHMPQLPSVLRWTPALFGALHAVVLVREGQRLRGRRHALVTGPMYLALGIAASVAAPRAMIGLALYVLGAALIAGASGALTLRRFLRTPLSVEPDAT